MVKYNKKKQHGWLLIGVGAMALYGAYSMVECIKEMCCNKAKMLTNMFKKKEKECLSDENCEDRESGY